jgi:hypothetical protein
MKKILVLVLVVMFITAINLCAQAPCEEIRFDDCWPLSLQGRILKFFHEFRDSDIKYNEGKLKRKIQYNQLALNYSIEGWVDLNVNINKKGKITKIKKFDYSSNSIKYLAIKAINEVKFRPARKDWKNIDDSINIEFSVHLPKKAYDFEFQGKMHKMEIEKSYYPYYRYVNLTKGSGKKINHLDSALVECLTYNLMQEFIEKDTIIVAQLPGYKPLPIEEVIIDMQNGGEKLILFEKYLLSKGLCTSCQDFDGCDKLLVKIKVLEINPK